MAASGPRFTESEAAAIQNRIGGLLAGPFRLLGAFAHGYGVDYTGHLVLSLSADKGATTFAVRHALTGVPETAQDLEPVRSFLRAAEERLARVISGGWPEGDPLFRVGDVLTLTRETLPEGVRV